MTKVHSQPIQVLLVALPLVAWGLERLVESAQPHMMLMGSARSVADSLVSIDQRTPDVVVVDLDGEQGAESLALLHSKTSAKILAVTGSTHEVLHDEAVMAGARGVVDKRDADSPSTLLKAIEKVHQGEIWIDRNATSRIFLELARRKSALIHNPEKQKIASLTRRELQALTMLASDPGSSSRAVAEKLFISEHTLRNHVTSIYSKLGLANRVDLYAFAQRNGLT
jgi:DNA-binding NarL/FixJ family response regulator